MNLWDWPSANIILAKFTKAKCNDHFISTRQPVLTCNQIIIFIPFFIVVVVVVLIITIIISKNGKGITHSISAYFFFLFVFSLSIIHIIIVF